MFSDIKQMKVSNDPQLTGADWQPFAQDVPWQLAPTQPGQVAKVYAQFRDAANNESLIVLSGITVQQQGGANSIYLPLIQR